MTRGFESFGCQAEKCLTLTVIIKGVTIMKRVLQRVNWPRVAELAGYFIVGWVTVPLMVSGTATGIRGLVGMIGAGLAAGLTGYRLGQENAVWIYRRQP